MFHLWASQEIDAFYNPLLFDNSAFVSWLGNSLMEWLMMFKHVSTVPAAAVVPSMGLLGQQYIVSMPPALTSGFSQTDIEWSWMTLRYIDHKIEYVLMLRNITLTYIDLTCNCHSIPFRLLIYATSFMLLFDNVWQLFTCMSPANACNLFMSFFVYWLKTVHLMTFDINWCCLHSMIFHGWSRNI